MHEPVRALLRSATILAATFAVVLGVGALVQLEPITGWDASGLTHADDLRSDIVTRAMRTITQLGDFPVSYGALLATGILVGLQRRSWTFALLPLATGFLQQSMSALASGLLDSPIAEGPQSLGNPGSFPSGGAARAVLWVGIVVLLASLDRPSWRSRVLPIALAAGAVEVVSRFYLGLHFPGDLVGGSVLGGGILVAAMAFVDARVRAGAATSPPHEPSG